MEEKLSRLKSQIEKIEELKSVKNWGPEFQLWERATNKQVAELFGEEGLKLFKGQQTVSFSYIDDDYNDQQYLNELEGRRKILVGLLAEFGDTTHDSSSATTAIEDSGVLKEIWRNEPALKENLLKTDETQPLYDRLKQHLEEVLPPQSLPGLRLRKMLGGKPDTWWSTHDGYPAESPWKRFEPLLELLQQYEAEKTIKQRLEMEGLFVEARSQGEDQHLLIGKRDGSVEKAHVIIDGKTGEIRVEDNQQEPLDLVNRVETILTLRDGRRIRTTREAIEESQT